MPSPGKFLAAATALTVAAALPSSASASDASLREALSKRMRAAGSFSGAYVFNATDNRAIFRWRYGRARVLASNTKLFTTAAALARFGTEGRLGTEVRGVGQLEQDGTWRGSLYLRGGGDPTFGSRRFIRRNYGSGATVEGLAARLEQAGIQRVTGRIYGDESRFDTRRGGPGSGFRTSIYVGPLSALAYNRGLARENGSAFQTRPGLFSAQRLDRALERRGVRVAGRPRTRRTPRSASVLASVDSPTMARLARITNKPSDNFFAEMLLKGLGLEATGRGTTRRGARVAATFARRLGGRARLVDGSGLSRGNRASPYRVVRLLLAMQRRDEGDAFYASLPIAGRDGTLRSRMRGGPARRRCRAKTGTISGVSALSGYCRARSGDLYAFSFLMNGVGVYTARAIQNHMAHAIAGRRD
jgi:D-alanyl-D-alanine carboxypeptidase/D-alanyl-D-alanine-endopeptidase (penicillin-binding protein 4)